MSCKSAIYTTNSTTQSLTEGSTLELGTIIRRFGKNLNLSGNGILVQGSGYYNVNANVTIAGTGTSDTVTVSLVKDGVTVPGAVATAIVATGDITTISLNALIREVCCNSVSTLTFVLGGASTTINSISVVAEKI